MNRDSVQNILKSCGEDVFISDMAEIKRPELVEIGNHVAIDSGVYITTAAQIGDYIHIAPYVTCIGGASANFVIEDFAGISAGARLICMGDEHLGEGLVGPTVPVPYKDKLVGGYIHVKRFAGIGTNAVIFPGLTIGEGSVIGAGSILTCDAEPWTIYVGSPARPVKKRRSDQMLAFAKELGY